MRGELQRAAAALCDRKVNAMGSEPGIVSQDQAQLIWIGFELDYEEVGAVSNGLVAVALGDIIAGLMLAEQRARQEPAR